MKTYRGIREPICHVRVLSDANGGQSASANPALPPSLPPATLPAIPPRRDYDLVVPRDLVTHAMGPFDWGAEGPGTHYLAVALLADLLGTGERAGIKTGLPFMRRFLSRLPKNDFEISDTILQAFLHAVAPAAPAGPPALPAKHAKGPSNDVHEGAGRKEQRTQAR